MTQCILNRVLVYEPQWGLGFSLCSCKHLETGALSIHVCFASLQRNAFANDTVPSESYISAVQAAHLGTLCGQSLPLAASLKHTLLSLVRLTGDLIV